MNSINLNFFFILFINFVFLLNFCHSADVNYKVIKINDGQIRGVKERTIIDKKEFYAFRGIPYGKPPTGDRRFRAPELPKPWNNVLDTIKYPNSCPQVSSSQRELVIGNEDCLYLNVFSPDVSPTANLSVMVYIHGGGFYDGSGDDFLYGPDFLIEENVIYVSLNYRLNVVGFLTLGTDEYSGNMGLKDQSLALKWVKANIHNFGGNNQEITIFGESAGSASTHLQVLSPSSKNIFKRAIAQSGSALNVWACEETKQHKPLLFDLARKNGQNLTTVAQLINYLKTVDIQKLVQPFPILYGRDITIVFGPVVEPKTAKSPFITELPEKIVRDKTYNKCDQMFGYNANEFLIFSGHDMENQQSMKDFNEKFQIGLPRKEFRFKYDSKEYKLLANEIRTYFFGSKNAVINKDRFYEYIELLSDAFFVYGIDRSAKMHSLDTRHKTFYYTFSVDAKLNSGKTIAYLNNVTGTSHLDDLCYIFSCKLYADKYSTLSKDSVEYKTIKTMTKLWTNFAKYGQPTKDGSWKPLNPTELNFVDIRNDGVKPSTNPHNRNLYFWNNLFTKYDYLLAKNNKNNLNLELKNKIYKFISQFLSL